MVAPNLQYAYTAIPNDLVTLEIVINDLITRTIPGLVSGGTWYFEAPSGGGVYPEGAWRFAQTGTDPNTVLEAQVYLSGTWTTAFKFSRPV